MFLANDCLQIFQKVHLFLIEIAELFENRKIHEMGVHWINYLWSSPFFVVFVQIDFNNNNKSSNKNNNHNSNNNNNNSLYALDYIQFSFPVFIVLLIITTE